LILLEGDIVICFAEFFVLFYSFLNVVANFYSPRMKRDKEKQRKAMIHEQEQTNNGNIDHDIRPNSQVQSLKRSSANISSL
jgi:hypothetical protein